MAIPGVQVTEMDPAPLMLAISTLRRIADIVPKFTVPKFPPSPNSHPFLISARTLKAAVVLAENAGKENASKIPNKKTSPAVPSLPGERSGNCVVVSTCRWRFS